MHPVGILGSKEHAGPRSAGIFTAAPLIPFCLPRGSFTNFINRILLQIVYSSKLFKSFNSSGISSKSIRSLLCFEQAFFQTGVSCGSYDICLLNHLDLKFCACQIRLKFLTSEFILSYLLILNSSTPFFHNNL